MTRMKPMSQDQFRMQDFKLETVFRNNGNYQKDKRCQAINYHGGNSCTIYLMHARMALPNRRILQTRRIAKLFVTARLSISLMDWEHTNRTFQEQQKIISTDHQTKTEVMIESVDKITFLR